MSARTACSFFQEWNKANLSANWVWAGALAELGYLKNELNNLDILIYSSTFAFAQCRCTMHFSLVTLSKYRHKGAKLQKVKNHKESLIQNKST